MVYKKKGIVLIIEGMDLSGKSTLIEGLNKDMKGISMKVGYKPEKGEQHEIDKFQEYMQSVMNYIEENQDKIIILDRYYPTELVYSKVKRGYEANDDKFYKDLEDSLSKINHLYIFCDPTKKVIIERFNKRGDEFIKEKDIVSLYDRYQDYYEKTKLKKIKINTNLSVSEMIIKIKELI